MGRRAVWLGAGVFALGLTAATIAAPVSASTAEDGQVRVVHGLRGLVADIYLDGTLVLPTFRPERSTDPLAIPAGDHLVEIRTAGAAMSETPLLSQTVTVPAGFRGSLVAHLDRDGDATLTAFADDLTQVAAGASRLVVRHAAEAAGVKVLLDDRPTFGALAPAKEVAGVVNAGDYRVAVTSTRGNRPLAPPEAVRYDDGTANFMYLIGSQSDGTLGWAAVQIDDLDTSPAMINTGDGSTRRDASSNGGPPVAVLVALAAATVAAAGATGHRWRARRVSD